MQRYCYLTPVRQSVCCFDGCILLAVFILVNTCGYIFV
uniref:Uncharacterized protein n=1 Tax=Podoviridae sp. ct8mF2 TaxID=2825224 RepID=A0A8S5PMP8_9CAUD|nr:MAG TPA: hypothetical protein [Podoviridae sp. ct8mF2]